MRPQALIGSTAAAGAAVIGYASVVERNWFVLRHREIPVLRPGARPLRVLHISDAHLTPGRHRLLSWIRSLDALQPDLVVNTGDSIAHPEAVLPFLEALGPLLDRPGVFVYGSNDLYSPVPKNPTRYLWQTSAKRSRRGVPDLPWAELGAGMEAAGWLDANNKRGRLKAGDLDIEVAGVHDPHIGRDRYDEIARPADPDADLRLGVLHSPEPAVLDRFAADGGQVCLPWYGTLVTNCGIDRSRARGLHRHPADGSDDDGRPWLHVSAGLGTSPWAPFRLCCRPEASLLTLVPRPG
jgi:predicted MPP superfamily phosphohydrolase